MKGLQTTVRLLVLSWMAVTILVSGLSGVVLCIGSDGHVAIEVAHDGYCGDRDGTQQRSARPEALVRVTNCHCCDTCIDVQLTLDASEYILEKQSVNATQVSDLLATCPVVVSSLPDHAQPRMIQPPGVDLRLSAALVAKRSIVLRV